MQELQHTSATLAAMDVSHDQLSRTRDEYIGQHGILKRSKGLLRTITWQQKSETILLWFGLALFILTASYVAQKRVLYFVPEALRPMAVVKTTYNILRGGTESKILANKSEINNKLGDEGGGGIPAAPRRKESIQRPAPAPVPRVDELVQKTHETAASPTVDAVESVEKRAIKEGATPTETVQEEKVEVAAEARDVVLDEPEFEEILNDDGVAPNVHVEL